MASAWNTFGNVSGSSMLIYFDAESVVRRPDVVTVWLKYVYDTGSKQSDNVYSLALRMAFNCKARTTQVLTSSSYDRDGVFIRTDSTAGTPQDIIPDSLGDGMAKAICAANFPNDKSGSQYAPTLKNDPRGEAAMWFDYKRAKSADPAPQ